MAVRRGRSPPPPLSCIPSTTVPPDTAVASRPDRSALCQLDDFRHDGALAGNPPARRIGLDDVKTLVHWKLLVPHPSPCVLGARLTAWWRRQRGHFRPRLLALVASNPAARLRQVVDGALQGYWADGDVAKATQALCALRGVGPATASLLLAVSHPERVVFFSDEAFFWLCAGGRPVPLRYSAAEYAALSRAAVQVADRLSVPVVDVEKVAYVLMQPSSAPAASPSPPPALPPAAAKRLPEETAAPTGPVRRSKRVRAAR